MRTPSPPTQYVKSGLPNLDKTIDGLRLGDNVVLKVEDLSDYIRFSHAFIRNALKEKHRCVYFRFAPHEPILDPQPGLEIIEMHPDLGFDLFSAEVHDRISQLGKGTFYVFDNLSSLVEEWATDELLAAFFQVTCPFLYEMDTVAYFALTRGRHAHAAVARIRDTTQVLLSVYHVKDKVYVHPLKVWGRYSSQMFLPHEITPDGWHPVFHSEAAAEVSALASATPLESEIRTIAPWDSVYRKLSRFRELDPPLPEDAPEIVGLKQEFSRMMLGNHPTFNRLVDQFLRLEDLFQIRNRLIGSGRIGGKAAGMLIARRILEKHKGSLGFSEILENHDSFFIGSDVFFTFLIDNDLFRLRHYLTKKPQYSEEEFREVEARFLTGEFPPEIVEQFRRMLDYYGQAPIIVRSSSLLEDSFGNAFAGKYRSEFCVNQGDLSRRLTDFVHAVKLIYASALSPDSLRYRRKRGLGDQDEQMAVLVQRVSGRPYRHYFFPSLAGVAMSRNLYVWNKRIDPQKGLVRLVFGLGTRAVNRVGNDYPRMIPLSHPGLRPESARQIPRYSQKMADVLNIQTNDFESLMISELMTEPDYPHLHLFVSEEKGGFLTDPVSTVVDTPVNQLVFTFNGLIGRKEFTDILDSALTELERVYRQTVEIEFTFSIRSDGRLGFNLLQCRPMTIPGQEGFTGPVPNVAAEDTLFYSNKFLGAGQVEKVRYLIYVDPRAYGKLQDIDEKRMIGRLIGRANERLAAGGEKLAIIGPGRWGSSNIDLGVNVSYGDIDNTCALIEIAHTEAGHSPEVSYGTHFFLDLVESNILYTAIYPDEAACAINEDFLRTKDNELPVLFPEHPALAGVIRIIDIPKVRGGRMAHLIADPQRERILCYVQ